VVTVTLSNLIGFIPIYTGSLFSIISLYLNRYFLSVSHSHLVFLDVENLVPESAERGTLERFREEIPNHRPCGLMFNRKLFRVDHVRNEKETDLEVPRPLTATALTIVF